MRKLIFFTILAFMMSAFTLQAENLYFCSHLTANVNSTPASSHFNYGDANYKSYNAKMTFCTAIEDGKPADDYTEFTIPPAGGYIYVYVMNDEDLNTTGTILTVYKKDYNGKYTDQVSKDDYTINGDIPGTYMKYSFYKAGDFKVQLTDKNYNIIATGYVTIKMKGSSNDDDDDEARYNAKMTFTTGVENGKPVDDYTTFNISPSGGYIYVYVMNDENLGVAKVTLKVYRKKSGNYTDEIASEDYDINGDIPGTYMQYTFYKAGDYKVKLVDKSNNTIATGYVTINIK
jgi:hypothetical protein